MNTPTPAKLMKTIVVTSRLDSGTAFGVTVGPSPQCVFIPAKVAEGANVTIGGSYVGILAPNHINVERTPWMAVRLDSALPLPVGDEEMPLENGSVAARVRDLLRDGGVWTASDVFSALFPGSSRTLATNDYGAVADALAVLRKTGQCAVFQLWRKGDSERPGREWFTCYPERADVDEWEADDA